MVKKIKFSIILVLLFAICYMLYVGKIQAADFSLGIYPPLLQIQVTAPVAIKKDITVVNASEDAEDVHIVFKSFTQSPYNNGQPQYVNTIAGPDKTIFDKMQLLDGDNPITNITLAPKEKKTLTLHIGLPKDEPSGDYYFSIILLSNQQADTSHNGSHITGGIATNVLLSVGGQDKTIGFLEEFSSPVFVQTGPIPFTILVQNASNHFISPTGHITIKNMFGQLIGIVDILPINILGSTSRYETSVGNPTTDNGLFTHPVVMWKEKALFGPYRATLVLSLSSDGPIFTKTIYFFAMPWEYMIGFCMTIVLVVIVVTRVRERLKVY